MASKPSKPTNVSASQVTSNSAYISFAKGADNGATQSDFVVNYSTHSDFVGGYQEFAIFLPGGKFTGLSRSTRYYVRIRGRNSEGYSPWSDTIVFLTSPELPGAPTPIAMNAQDTTAFRYQYAPPTNDGGDSLIEYQVGYGTDPNTQSTVIGVDRNTDVTIGGLSRNTTYYAWSRVRNNVGFGPWSNRSQTTTQTALPAPPIPVFLGEQTQVSFRYQFQDQDNGGSDILERQMGYGTDPNNIQNVISTGNDRTFTGLSPYTTYYIWSRVRNQAGWSGWSARSQIQTKAGALLLTGGSFKAAIPYVKIDGAWRIAQPFIKRTGLWKTTE